MLWHEISAPGGILMPSIEAAAPTNGVSEGKDNGSTPRKALKDPRSLVEMRMQRQM